MDVAVVDQEAYLKVMEKQRKTLIIPLPRDDATVLNQAFSSTISDLANTKKTVRFDTVTVHEHPIIIGCNPAVTSGVPITIAWNSVSSRKIPFLEFEFDRRKKRVANPAFLKQTKSERWNILQNLGFASDEMRLAEHEAQEIRCLRNLTYMEYTDDLASCSRIQALLQEARARREYILKRKPRRSMNLRRFFV